MADLTNMDQPLAPKRDLNQKGPDYDNTKDDAVAVIVDDNNNNNNNVLSDDDDDKDDDNLGVMYDDFGSTDDIKEIAPEFQATHFLKFKWNPLIKDLGNCDTKHLLLCTWHALMKTRERTIERNKHFKSLNRDDRIQKYQDNPRIMSNLIEWHNKDCDNNKYDGDLLTKKGKKKFINDVLTAIGGTKMGWSTKIYHYLTKEVDISDVSSGDPIPILIPNYGYTKLASDGKILEECSIEELKILLNKLIFPQCIKQNLNNKKGGWALIDKQNNILKFIDDRNMTGDKLVKMGKKTFMRTLANYLDPKNKKINGPINKMYTTIMKANINDITF